MKFHLSAKAKTDIADIWQYTNKAWGSKQADNYLDTLYNRLIWLTRNTTIWRQRNDILEGLYSCREGRHIIYFRNQENIIEIARILHDSMDAPQNLS